MSDPLLSHAYWRRQPVAPFAPRPPAEGEAAEDPWAGTVSAEEEEEEEPRSAVCTGVFAGAYEYLLARVVRALE